MASLAARAVRNREARDRLDASLAAISKRLDIPVPDEPRRMRDAELQPIVELERFADFAEAVEAALDHLAREGDAPGGYETWTVAMLKAEMSKRELPIESGSKKDDLILALMEDDEAPDDDMESDDAADPDDDAVDEGEHAL